MTDIQDDELVRIAAFKLGDTARALGMLAKEAEMPRLQQLLTASSAALEEQAQKLRIAAENLEGGPLTLPVIRIRMRALGVRKAAAPRVRTLRRSTPGRP